MIEMKRIALYLMILVLASVQNLMAATYTVEEIPNVHLRDSTKFVSNPDGILTAEGERRANELLHSLMANTTAEVVAVAVDDIEEGSDINDFATELFRAWGLGKKDTNNGGLLLIVKDRRQYVFRTGSGLEGLLPDGLAGSIMRAQMRPRFREGDYDGGTVSTLSEFCSILSDPVAADEIRSKYANNGGESEGPDLFGMYLKLCLIVTLCLLAWLGYTWLSVRKKKRYERYLAANKLYTPMMFCTFAGLGIPLLAFLPLLLWRHHLRRGTHLCPDCGEKMRLVDEEHDNDYLTHAQDIEERIGAVDYDVWVCPKDGETEVIPYVSRSTDYTVCPVCHARTMRTVSDRTVQAPTTTREGLRMITRRCMNCGFEDNTDIRLPKVIAPVIIVGGTGRGNGGFGGGIGGGSFGGGFTAGGGASGSW